MVVTLVAELMVVVYLATQLLVSNLLNLKLLTR